MKNKDSIICISIRKERLLKIEAVAKVDPAFLWEVDIKKPATHWEVSHLNARLHLMNYVCELLQLNAPIKQPSSFYSQVSYNDITSLMTNRKSQR